MAAPSTLTKSSYKTFERCNLDHKRDPNPKKAVLIVIDMQNYFAPLAEPIIPTVKTTIQLCQKVGIPVIYTRICKGASDEGGVLGEWWNGQLIIDGTPESELIPEVVAVSGTTTEVEIVEKKTYSAFRNTRLEERLLEMGVEEVIITGVMTNLCCETTAREVFVRDFRVFFSTDATATESEELHQASLKNLAHGFAYLVDCHKLSKAFAS